jgi:hypothetical protein
MDDERMTPAATDALPLAARAAAYLGAQQRLEQRLELPGA